MSEQFGQAFWDERYSSKPAIWSGKPNPQLVRQVTDLEPGAALDVGSGEGADAIWLAQRGWLVTGVDISQVALDRAAAQAARVGVAARITWLREDITAWRPEPARYDLVSAQFMHLPAPARDVLFRDLAAAVTTGGTLLIVAHHPSDLQTTVPRPPMPERFYTADEIAGGLDSREWDVVTSAAEPRSVLDPEGRDVTIHDTVLMARRIG
jgi:SAM-dependent methyltransferase